MYRPPIRTERPAQQINRRGPPRSPEQHIVTHKRGAEGGSPYASTYNGVSSYTSLLASSPMFPYPPYSPTIEPPPLSCRTSSGGAGRFPGTPEGLGLSHSLDAPSSDTRGGGLRTLRWARLRQESVHPRSGNSRPRRARR